MRDFIQICRPIDSNGAWSSESYPEKHKHSHSPPELEQQPSHSSYGQTKEGKVKGLLAGLCGFALSLALFLSGAAVATFILTGKPAREPRLDMNQSEIWTKHARAVDTAAQQFERLPARAAATDLSSKVIATANEAEKERPSEPRMTTIGNGAEEELPSEPLDTTVTGSIQPMPKARPTAHVEWCASRYRSYRPHDNSYTPFSGGRRTCISPYIDAARSPTEDVSPPPRDIYAEDADDPSRQMDLSVDPSEGTNLTQEHVSYCFSRYRSYRPEDNSYQPYDGGARRQCR
ncbi:BA14K family protein [Sinorhizobium numidicum]|uniref:Lectin-like protein BA14k n=1 Tax=Sinorhizobium numidicum TaxID=680248 RepID=A0ABY8CVZ4_9HYPH|nr:BA14K family protein [Sinorhizobium numidicum]WEX78931.1 BA14K family protein [Sinorhizobium numidicum]WEX82327.1 BA14K family protein [Sinorhizobium numidicum]